MRNFFCGIFRSCQSFLATNAPLPPRGCDTSTAFGGETCCLPNAIVLLSIVLSELGWVSPSCPPIPAAVMLCLTPFCLSQAFSFLPLSPMNKVCAGGVLKDQRLAETISPDPGQPKSPPLQLTRCGGGNRLRGSLKQNSFCVFLVE